jgi:phage head maturation protease
MNDMTLRTMEHEGKRYVYGYAVLFDSPDGHGTIATKEFVENNMQRLKKYPAVRFQHTIPLGQIDWEVDLGNGIQTRIDDHGFHVVARIYDERQEEYNMIKNGNWGWSFGSRPDGWGKRCIGDKCYPSFEKGVIYEVSIVDSPSHIDSSAAVIERAMSNTFDVNELYQDVNFPSECSPSCQHRTCPFYKTPNFGRLCFHKFSNVKQNP